MDEETKNAFQTMSREELLRALEMFAKNWLAHDGCWFLAAEERFDMETAIDLDARSWKRFAAAEARRIMTTFDVPANGGLGQALKSVSFGSMLSSTLSGSNGPMIASIYASSWMFVVSRKPGVKGPAGLPLQKCRHD